MTASDASDDRFSDLGAAAKSVALDDSTDESAPSSSDVPANTSDTALPNDDADGESLGKDVDEGAMP